MRPLRPAGRRCAALFPVQDRAAYPAVSQSHLIRPAWGSHPPATAADDRSKPVLHLLGNFLWRAHLACEATPARTP
jgi:hypothetical protein